MPGGAAAAKLTGMNIDLQVLIVDDNAPFLEAARTLLQADGMPVVGTASTGAEAVAFCLARQPDVALVDVMLGPESGFAVARRLAEMSPLLNVILISTHAERDFHELIVQSPARGFLSKSELSADAVRGLLAPPAEASASGRSGI
jgi:two-component system, NarL family, nitrate/nitrite response regulator NarL